jgi:hypothetical protein
MLTELYSGDYSLRERRNRYTLAMCTMEGGTERAVSLAEELLRDAPDDAGLWAAYLENKLAFEVEETSQVTEIVAFLARDLSTRLKLSAVSKIIGRTINPTTSTVGIYTLLWIYRSGKPEAEAVDAYLSLVEALLSSGRMSLARDVLEFLMQDSGFDEAKARFSDLIDVIVESHEKPILTLSALMLQLSSRLDSSDELFNTLQYSTLMPYAMAAWVKLRDTGAILDYQHLPLAEREELLDSFTRHVRYLWSAPSEIHLSDVLARFYQEDIDWREAQGYSVGTEDGPDDEVDYDDFDDDEEMKLPEFDDEDYLNFVDYVVDHYEQIFPGSPPEQRVFVPLFLLPVYAEGSRIPDVKAALSPDTADQGLLAYMREMMKVAEDLWQSQTTHDEVDKAMLLMGTYDFASDVCGKDFAYESIEMMLSTMHHEKKTILKLMKEHRREKR